MKKDLLSSVVALLVIALFATMSFGARAEESLTALKKFRARCEVGISFRDYSGALADSNYEIKEFINSDQAKKNPELTEYISTTFADYVFAGSIWDLKISGRHKDFVGPDDDIWKSFIKYTLMQLI